MEKISWLDKVTSEEALGRVNEARQILNSVLQRKHRSICHVLRRDRLLYEIIEDRMRGKPTKGRIPMLHDLANVDGCVTLIVQHHGLMGHSYADDTCIYIHVDASSCAVVLPTVTACLDAINSWMASNRLRLNMEKTQLTWLGTAQQLRSIFERSR